MRRRYRDLEPVTYLGCLLNLWCPLCGATMDDPHEHGIVECRDCLFVEGDCPRCEGLLDGYSIGGRESDEGMRCPDCDWPQPHLLALHHVNQTPAPAAGEPHAR